LIGPRNILRNPPALTYQTEINRIYNQNTTSTTNNKIIQGRRGEKRREREKHPELCQEGTKRHLHQPQHMSLSLILLGAVQKGNKEI
jgi:hypothetical protein